MVCKGLAESDEGLNQLTQQQLGEAAGLQKNTIFRVEKGEAVKPKTCAIIVAELERRGIEFSNGFGIGVRLVFAKAEAFAKAEQIRRSSGDNAKL
jgi:DNA-binding XRE family transcriptional regulator